MEKESRNAGRYSLDSANRRPVEGFAGAISKPQHLLETVETLGRKRNVAENLAKVY